MDGAYHQKGSLACGHTQTGCHVWWKRGERPPGFCDRCFTYAYIFAAVSQARTTSL